LLSVSTSFSAKRERPCSIMAAKATSFTLSSQVMCQSWSQIKVRSILIVLDSGLAHRRLSIFDQTQLTSEQLDEMIRFIEIVRLCQGSSFGELALQNESSGLRKTKVIWKTDCQFAVVNKDNYQKVLQKVQQQNKDKMTNYLKQIPFISHWSRSLLSKLYYAIEKTSCIRGQKVVKEGDPIEYIYIVWSGEYEVIKYLGKGEEDTNIINEEEQLIRPLLNHEDAKSCQAIQRTKEWHDPSRFKRKIRLSVLGEWKLLCDSDARFGKPSTVTIEANNTKGELYRIKASDFMKYIKSDTESWNKFTLHWINKEKEYGRRIHTFKQNFKHKKNKSHKINLLDQRKKNAENNTGELDVRNSFDYVIKTMESVRSKRLKSTEFLKNSKIFQKDCSTSINSIRKVGWVLNDNAVNRIPHSIRSKR